MVRRTAWRVNSTTQLRHHFQRFQSATRFHPIGSTVTNTTFSIPGTMGGTPAEVDGFGAVFNNVELANSAKMDFFDPNGKLLTEQFVPTGTGAASLSFLGYSSMPAKRLAA